MTVPSRTGPARAKARTLFAVAAATTAAAAVVLAAPAAASAATHGRPAGQAGGSPAGNAVFVQTDNTAGNQVVAYDRSASGTLTLAGTYDTGGKGGQLTGSVVDHLASQGSLQYDAQLHVLIAVNAGSNSVTVFGVHGSRLHRLQIIGSGGQFPVSVAIHGNLVYVLNALRGGSVQGYRLSSAGHLAFLSASHRPLGLNPSATPQFTNTPGQVAFSPSGAQLVVTTKANGNDIDVFGVGPGGRPSASPVVNAEGSTVPFAIAFDQAGHLVIADAGTNALATFTLGADGTVTLIDSVGTGQAGTCWVAPAGGTLYASNAGSANVSGYTSSASGQLTLLGQTPTDPGTVDAAATPDGQFLYVQTGGNGIVDEFSVGTGGSLTSVGSVTVAGAAGGEGIAAS
jgi:6-phosphogluconolactonase (cycloisomerase 2 family)